MGARCVPVAVPLTERLAEATWPSDDESSLPPVAGKRRRMSPQTGIRADDSYSGRQPTSHERRAGQPWDASYLDGPAPLGHGQPQPAIVLSRPVQN
jgi:hypothetical protein